MAAPAGRPPFWRDIRFLRVLFQTLFLLAVAGVYYFLADNLTTNLRRQGLRRDFGFLDQPAGFAIPDSEFRSSQSLRASLVTGVRNTAAVALIGVVLALALGTIVGVARLSANWLVRRAAALYVEAIRNIPVLVIIFFWYLAVVLKLPLIDDSIRWFGVVDLSVRGFLVPSFVKTGEMSAFLIALLAALAACSATWVWRTVRFNRAGKPHHRVLWSAGTLIVILSGAYLALGRPFEISLPAREGLVTRGGIRMGPEYAALLVALTLYTASHIAEIVRGSILAVPKGQGEAATALGLSTAQRLRLVVLPQAFRIMIPPLANQFLNLTKNSSLAVAIGYYDITRVVGIMISQGAPAPQSIVILMLIYLGFSLSISLAANLVNRRLQVGSR